MDQDSCISKDVYKEALIDETISIIVVEPAKQSFSVLSLLVVSPSL